MPDAYILGGVRTPVARYGGSLSHVRTDDLLGRTMVAACEKVGVPLERIEDITAGCVNVAHEGMGDIARWGALAAGFLDSVPAVTVNRFCASSLTGAISIAHAIRSDELAIGLARRHAGGERLEVLRSADLAAVDHPRVVGHVLRLERRHRHAPPGEGRAEGGRDHRLARPAQGPRHHQRPASIVAPRRDLATTESLVGWSGFGRGSPVSSGTETGDDDVAHLFRLDEESVMTVWRMYERHLGPVRQKSGHLVLQPRRIQPVRVDGGDGRPRPYR
jgi:hypothetical protein